MAQDKADLAKRQVEAGLADRGQQKQLQEALAAIAALYGGGDPALQRSRGQAELVR